MAEVTTLSEAVAGLVRDGDSVALEGFTHLIPFAAGHEILRQGRRTFVDKLDCLTTVGYGDGPRARERLGFRGRGPTAVITDLGVLEPDAQSRELTLTQVHDGVEVDQVHEATGWDLRVADELVLTPPPTERELSALRELVGR